MWEIDLLLPLAPDTMCRAVGHALKYLNNELFKKKRN
jgi:hypothetical protein